MSSGPSHTAAAGGDAVGSSSVEGMPADATAAAYEIRRPTYYNPDAPPPPSAVPPAPTTGQLVLLAVLSPLLLLGVGLYAVCASPFILSGYCAGQPSSARRQPALTADDTARRAAYMRNSRGLWLYTRAWLPASSDVRGVVVLIHGLDEHCSRPGYEELAARLVAAGYAVHAMDHAGHGRSTGLRSYTERFHFLVDDQLAFVHSLDSAYAHTTPRLVFGHSLGGLIALHVVGALQHQPAASPTWRLAGCVLSAPAAQVDEKIATPVNVFLARTLSILAPKVRLDSLDSAVLSRDPAVVARHDADPLNNLGGLRARLGHEILQAQSQLVAEKGEGAVRLSSFTVPVLLLHGGADVVCTLSGSRMVLNRVGSADKRLIVYDGRYHEQFEDPEKDVFFADILQFVESHTQTS